MQVQEWLIERQQLLERIRELEAENTELRKRLGEDVKPIKKKTTATQNLSLQEKVDLFRSLFKGREDVFARGIYGLGHIGSAVACIAQAFGMRVLAVTSRVPEALPVGVERVEWECLLEEADVLSLHGPSLRPLQRPTHA